MKNSLHVSAAFALVFAPLLSAAPVTTTASVIEAVRSGDVSAVKSLLKQGADVNAVEGDGMTALHIAVQQSNEEVAQLLAYAGANLKATTRLGGYTPLLLASRTGDAPMVATLLKAGADPNAGTTNGTTPLMFAAASGDVDAVRTLLDAKADIAAKETAMGQSALMFAAARGRTPVVKLLLSRGADVKASSKVVDLSSYTKEMEEQFRIASGQAAREAQGGAQSPQGAPPAGPPVEASKADAKPGLKNDAAKPDPAMSSAMSSKDGGDKNAKAEKQAKAEAEKEAKQDKDKKGKQDAKAEGIGHDAMPKPDGKSAAAATVASTQATGTTAGGPAAAGQKAGAAATAPRKTPVGGVDRAYLYNELIAYTGGMTPLLFAVRQGHDETVKALLDAGADINQVSGDKTSPLLMAVVNGRFDLAKMLLDRGADPNLASENGVAPLYATINVQWAPKALYPQPRAYTQQKMTHIEMLQALLDKGANPNARLKKKVWYSGYNFDLAGVDETGATAFWRAAYGADVEAMRLLKTRGADPNLWTQKPAGRPRTGDAMRDTKDVSGLPPVPVGAPAVAPIHAASGVGYSEGFAANSHRYAPAGMLPAVKFLIEECGADPKAVDHEGNTAMHHAASRGDNELIKYLLSKGADPMVVNREGQTTVDMANSPAQRTEPFPDTIKFLEGLGVKNNNNCTSCDLGPKKGSNDR